MELEDIVFWVFVSLVIGVLVFECGLLVYAYTHADEVECNLLWCTFKTTLRNESIYVTSVRNITTTTTCFVNGVEQDNCSEWEGIIK